jgi:hypothetical protein
MYGSIIHNPGKKARGNMENGGIKYPLEERCKKNV